MKTRLALIAVTTLAAAVGCSSKKTTSASALDINEPATPVYSAPKPVAQPVAAQPVAQPVIHDTAPVAAQPANAYAMSSQPQTMGGGSYQVKKGDTLFSIAKTRYGNGNQWQRIAQANPGLTPQNLKAGQTIALP